MANRIKKDDTVVVISGRNKGAQGRVLRVMRAESRVVIEGVNIIKRHQKPLRGVRTEGEIITREAPLSLSKVMLWDESKKAGTRVRMQEKDGKKIRVSVKSGNVLDQA